MTEHEFNERQSDLLRIVPPELKGIFSCIAWEKGHAHGYEEIILVLSDLVESFMPSIKNYGDRRFEEGHDFGVSKNVPQ